MIRYESMNMIRVVLVDDHVVVRSGFAQLLSLEEDLDIVGQFSSAAQAWPALLRDDINVAVMDIAMPDENGLSLLKRLRAQKPQFRAIILSIYDTPTFVQSALDAGASGYLTKRCGPEELVQAVRSVGMGGHYLCADTDHQHTNTCHTPDALHAFPHCGLGLDHETGKASPGSETGYQSRELFSEGKTRTKKKG